MAKFSLAHTLSNYQQGRRAARIVDDRDGWQYNETYAAETGLRGIAGDIGKTGLPSLGYGITQLGHQTRVNNNRNRVTNLRIDEAHLDSDSERDISAENLLIRSVTLDEQAEDLLYALPPSQISLENIQCVLEATNSNRCNIEAGEEMPPLSVHDYDKLFLEDNNFLPPAKQHGALIFDDAAFARNALIGPNPTLVEKVTFQKAQTFSSIDFDVLSIPSTTLFQGGSPFLGMHVSDLLAQGKLFYEEYVILEQVTGQPSDPGTGKEERITFAPRVLYGLVDEVLMPICIQCRRTNGSGAENGRIFYPHTTGAVTYELDLAVEDADYSWQIAKTIVLHANVLHHEAVAHLGLTHLLMESFFVAAGRRFSTDHPVFGMIKPHMFGTFFINHQARTSLLAEGGDIDLLLPTPVEQFPLIFKQAIMDIVVDKAFLPEALRKRGVHPVDADSTAIPGYRYADDGLLHWNAIRTYVENFLSHYYKQHADLTADLDGELGAFLNEISQDQLVEGTNTTVRGLNFAEITDRESLYDLVTMIIFTSSCQHSAVNSAQADVLGNAAWCPTTIYRDAPGVGETASRRDYMETLPPFTKAVGQVSVGYQLGGLVIRPLPNLVATQYAAPWFSDYGEILAALRTYRDTLADIEQAINSRNAPLPEAEQYPYLIPSRVAQSISV